MEQETTLSTNVSSLSGNFLMLRITLMINGKPSKPTCDDRKWLTLSNGSHDTDVTFDSFAEDVDDVLQNIGVEGFSNYWCDETPLFQIKATTHKDVKHFLRLQGKIQEKLALKVETRLRDKSSTASLHVEVHTKAYVMVPDYSKMDGKVYELKEETFTLCMDVCKQNGVHDFGAQFKEMYKKQTMEETGPESLQQLVDELKEVVDWIHMGLNMGIPEYELRLIEASHSHDQKKCRMYMLQHWMQTETNKKWSTIVQALYNIGHRNLAMKVAFKYGVPFPQKKTVPNYGDMSSFQKIIEEKEMMLEKKDQELALAESEKENLSKKVARIEQKRVEAQEQTDQLTQEVSELREALLHKEQELEAHEKEIQSLRRSSEELEEELKAQKVKELREYEEKLRRVEDKLKAAKAKRDNYQKKLGEVRIELAEKSGEATELRKILQQTKIELQEERKKKNRVLSQRMPPMPQSMMKRKSRDTQRPRQYAEQVQDKTTQLFRAAGSGDVATVTRLTDSFVNVNSRREDDRTALHLSSQGGHVDVVHILLKPRHANVDSQDKDGWTALHLASQEGHDGVVRVLIEAKAHVNQTTSVGWTALHLASQRGKTSVVDVLIEARASVNQQIERNSKKNLFFFSFSNYKGGRTALHLASKEGHVKVVHALIAAGAHINQNIRDGCTALYQASEKGHSDVVELLLNNGANVNIRNEDGSTALHQASRYNHSAVVELLLKYYANVTIYNKAGRRAIDLATSLRVEKLLRDAEPKGWCAQS